MCWAEHTEADQGVMTDKSVDGFLFVGRLDRDGLVVVTVLTDLAMSLPGETK